MRFYKKRNHLLMLCLVFGFFVGIIYENVIATKEVVMSELFMKSNMQLFLKNHVTTKKYALYVLKERTILVMWLWIFSCLKWRKTFAVILVGISGFLSGQVIVLSVLQLGMGGILLCIMGVLPQLFFYGVAGYILISYLYSHPQQQWNHTKSVFAVYTHIVNANRSVNRNFCKFQVGIAICNPLIFRDQRDVNVGICPFQLLEHTARQAGLRQDHKNRIAPRDCTDKIARRERRK